MMPIRIRSTNTPNNSTTVLLLFVTSASAAAYSLWKLIQWRARQVAQETLEEATMHEGPLVRTFDDIGLAPALPCFCQQHSLPLIYIHAHTHTHTQIDTANVHQCQQVFAAAIRRAAPCWSLQPAAPAPAAPMDDQVGGRSSHKRPMRATADYILKPLLMMDNNDHRGIREVHLYESVFQQQHPDEDDTATAASGSTTTLLDTTRLQALLRLPFSLPTILVHALDTLAMALLAWHGDPIVRDLEQRIQQARHQRIRQAALLRRLASLLPAYHGVVHVVAEDASSAAQEHLLLHNVVHRFTTPCVMDVKMGQETYVRTLVCMEPCRCTLSLSLTHTHYIYRNRTHHHRKSPGKQPNTLRCKHCLVYALSGCVSSKTSTRTKSTRRLRRR